MDQPGGYDDLLQRDRVLPRSIWTDGSRVRMPHTGTQTLQLWLWILDGSDGCWLVVGGTCCRLVEAPETLVGAEQSFIFVLEFTIPFLKMGTRTMMRTEEISLVV